MRFRGVLWTVAIDGMLMGCGAHVSHACCFWWVWVRVMSDVTVGGAHLHWMGYG